MTTYLVMVCGFAPLALMMAQAHKRPTLANFAGGIAVAGVWFALCLAVLE